MKKKFLGITYECCNKYGRLYPNKDNTYYVGRCPGCGRPVKVKIGTSGKGLTDSRFFRAG